MAESAKGDDAPLSRNGDPQSTGVGFRRLRVWHDALDLAVEVYLLTARFPGAERFGLARQIRNAAASIPANIAEGYRRGTRRNYLAFVRIAAGSHGELETHLEIASRVGLLSEDETRSIKGQLERVGRQLTRLAQALRVE